jgi:SAM-dependent methyltransferase
MSETPPNVHIHSFADLSTYYNQVLNKDKSTFCSKNDESTPIELVSEIIAKIPQELWERGCAEDADADAAADLKILDPCCGNGNFALPIYHRLIESGRISPKEALENIIYMTDINTRRLANVRAIFSEPVEAAADAAATITPNVKELDFLTTRETLIQTLGDFPKLYDLIIANPPYAKIDSDGKRSAKNHNMIRPFVLQCISLLKPDGIMALLIPDNWMSKSDRNDLCLIFTELTIVHLNIHTAKRHFKNVGSSFTWIIVQNRKSTVGQTMCVSGIWRGCDYVDTNVPCMIRSYIPLLYNSIVQRILEKTIERVDIAKIGAAVSCELHRTTRKVLLVDSPTGLFCNRVVHTPTQTLWSSKAHGLQGRMKIFISITDKYSVWMDLGVSGMTQAVVYVLCETVAEAEVQCLQLRHPLFVFLNNICRWGKFNNIRVIQSFPKLPVGLVDEMAIYDFFGLTESEIAFIRGNV